MDLLFSRPRYVAGDPLDLVLGGSGGGTGLPVTLQGTIYFAAMSASGTLLYDNRLPAMVSTAVTAPHQSAERAEVAPAAPWSQPVPIDAGRPSRWQSADRAEGSPVSPWDKTDRADVAAHAPWQHASPVSQARSALHQVCTPLDVLAAIGWQHATPLSVGLHAPHQVANALQVALTVSAQTGRPLSVNLFAPHQVATPALRSTWARWQVAAQLIPPGLSVYVPPGGGGITPHPVSLDLVFACPPTEPGQPLDLVFGHVCLPPVGPSAPAFILPARFYMTAHSLEAHRLPDLAPVRIFDASISAEAGAYGWTFSATAPVSVFEQLAPSSGLPAQIRITLDGIPFAFVVDSLTRTEQFGQRRVRLAGRSITALLGRPFARETQRTNTAPFTAQQLALQALEFTGVGLNWGLTDWLVPAGAWSHSGTPLAAVQAIVEAAGGYLQSARNAATLLARHPYPTLTGGMLGGPWNWYAAGVVPDVELAPDSIVTSSIERTDGPDVNAVYVSGVSQGVRRLVKRTGSAANKLASMVTDPLMVADEVALQRGTAILGAAGPKHLVRLDLPVLTGASEPGVLDVGQLVQVNAAQPWRGRVRSVGVSATFGRSVRQSVQIERHLEVTP
jgi:hypothetical protein